MIFTIHDKIHDNTHNDAMFVSASIDSLGAQLISLKDTSGREHIWQRDPAVWGFCSFLQLETAETTAQNLTANGTSLPSMDSAVPLNSGQNRSLTVRCALHSAQIRKRGFTTRMSLC